MIEQDRYIRMTYFMGKDLGYVHDNLLEHKTVLSNNFGLEKYKEVLRCIEMLLGNVEEMRQDLRTQGLI